MLLTRTIQLFEPLFSVLNMNLQELQMVLGDHEDP